MYKKSILFLAVVFVLLLSACKGSEYQDYIDTYEGYEPTLGTLSNSESMEDLKSIYEDETVDDLKVIPVEFDNDFIFGVDMSSIIAVEEAGGVFYNSDGTEQDVFEILSDYGINYVRIRLWHNPYNADGEPFGGGNNDTNTGIEIAKRAARVGMKIALDFHYSDFWADPGKQNVPYAWESLSDAELKEAIYDYTFDTIKAFEDEGVRPHMVQIGNEINNGMVYPKGRVSIYGYDKLAEYLSMGLNAVNDINPEIKTVIHIAEGASIQRVTYFFDQIIENGVEFDVIGLSYYSFWHGTMEEFKETLKEVATKYSHEVAIMEYSYGYTDYSNEFSNNIYSSGLEEAGGYKTSMQGQVSYIRDVNEAIASIDTGIGSFYWEPAWLAVDGAGWATEGAIEYLERQDDAVGIGDVSWANQALFSFTGKVLPTIEVFNLMKGSQVIDEVVLEYDETMDFVLNIRSNDSLPEKLIVYTNLDRRTTLPIVWNQSELDAITETGNYTVTGTVQDGDATLTVTCNVEAFDNYVLNSSFEEGGRVANDVTDFSNVASWDVTQSVAGAVKIESKNARTVENQGSNNLNLWASQAYTFEMTQEITLQPGTYTLSVWARSADKMAEATLFVKIDGSIHTSEEIVYGASWSDWTLNSITFTIDESETILIGLNGDCSSESWAHFDDFALRTVEE